VHLGNLKRRIPKKKLQVTNKISSQLSKLSSLLNSESSIVDKQLLNFHIRFCKKFPLDVPDYDDAWIYAVMMQSKDVFDIGCNCGFFSVLACLTDASRKVVAADANPEVLSTASRMLFLNGISEQVRFVLGFVSDKENLEEILYTTGSGEAGSMYSSHAESASALDRKIKAKTTTLDHIMEDTGIIPEFVKMDIEGAEKFALMGGKKLASYHSTRFIVEVHSNPQLSIYENTQSILDWCNEVGYSAYYLKRHVLLTSVITIEHRHRCHFLLQPEAWPYPEYLKDIQQQDSLEKAHSVLVSRGLI
jgi:FkbM family methyltransferase